jgi:hypothetical protein
MNAGNPDKDALNPGYDQARPMLAVRRFQSAFIIFSAKRHKEIREEMNRRTPSTGHNKVRLDWVIMLPTFACC